MVLNFLNTVENNGVGAKTNSLYFAEHSFDLIEIGWPLHAFGVWVPICLGLFGITGNIINIHVLRKMGLSSESGNIALLAISVADLGVMTFFMADIALFSYLIYLVDLPLHHAQNIQIISKVACIYARQVTTQVTCFLTAFLAIQRCVSVSRPFDVNEYFSPRRTILGIVLIVVSVVLTYSPIYLSNMIGSQKEGDKRFYFEILPPIIRLELKAASYLFNKLVMRPLCMIVVVMCHCIIAYKVNASQNVLHSGTDSDPSMYHRISSREKKMIKMLAIISGIFVICYIPETFIFAMGLFRTMNRPRENLFGDIVRTILEGINSSSNFIILYIMSSKYKNTLKAACCCFQGRH